MSSHEISLRFSFLFLFYYEFYHISELWTEGREGFRISKLEICDGFEKELQGEDDASEVSHKSSSWLFYFYFILFLFRCYLPFLHLLNFFSPLKHLMGSSARPAVFIGRYYAIKKENCTLVIILGNGMLCILFANIKLKRKFISGLVLILLRPPYRWIASS